MDHIQNGVRGVSLLVNLNWDQLFFFGTIIAGLLAGAFLGSVVMQAI